ncbi:hypothetical protein V496_09065 [Pseudogymnoascus sp. VKM F-4515 (FW-2607)]|nr:hypothetical protein V496_09065 [Pseudogymnoascus sp. VKM F-4515 (FW-2607)]
MAKPTMRAVGVSAPAGPANFEHLTLPIPTTTPLPLLEGSEFLGKYLLIIVREATESWVNDPGDYIPFDAVSVAEEVLGYDLEQVRSSNNR